MKELKKKFWNKATRRILIIFSSLLLAGAAVVIQTIIVNNQTVTSLVYVASDNLKPYTSVTGKLEQRNVVQSEIPEDAITDLKQLEGQTWVTNEVGIPKGIPVSKSLLVTAKESKYGEAIELTDGAMFIGVQTDQVRSAGDMIKPGTIADAYVYIAGDDRTPAKLVSPKVDPRLKGLLIKDRQNQNGYEPKKEGEGNQNPIPAIAVVETNDPEVAAALIQYQEEGKFYFVPTGVDLKDIAQLN